MAESVQKNGRKIIENVGKVIIGKEETVTFLLTALLTEGHVLLEDMPGTGKTQMAKALAASLEAAFSRIQFTPDLLPSDVTGLNVFNRKIMNLNYEKVLFLPIYCLLMKLTGQLPEPSRGFWSVWRKNRLQ